MTRRRFEVHGVDASGDHWIVSTDIRDTAEALANKFLADGYTNVRIVENC